MPNYQRVHPGRLLAREIAAREMTANALAVALCIPVSRVHQILKGKRSITADTALRLGRYLGTGPHIWINMQSSYDIWKAEKEMGKQIRKEVVPATTERRR